MQIWPAECQFIYSFRNKIEMHQNGISRFYDDCANVGFVLVKVIYYQTNPWFEDEINYSVAFCRSCQTFTILIKF